MSYTQLGTKVKYCKSMDGYVKMQMDSTHFSFPPEAAYLHPSAVMIRCIAIKMAALTSGSEILNKCVVCVLVLKMGHSADGCLSSSILFKFSCRVGHLFVLNWASIRSVDLGSVVSEQCTLSSMVFVILLCFRLLNYGGV